MSSRTATPKQRAALDAGRAPLSPAPKGHTRSLRHGMHSPRTVEARAAELRAQWATSDFIPGYQPHNEPLVTMLSTNFAKQELGEAWCGEQGYWDKRGRLTDVAKHLTTLAAEARRLLTALGMDLTRQGVTVSGHDLAKMWAEAHAQETSAEEVGPDGS